MSDQPLSQPTYAPVQAPAIEVPNYLRLHWVVVFLITIVVNKFLGGGLGTALWLLMQVKWVKKVTGQTKAYNLTLASIVLFVIVAAIAIFTGIFYPSSGTAGSTVGAGQAVMALVLACVMFITLIAGTVLYLMGAFALRSELEAAPFGIKLSGPMTFFFSSIYFQYHLQKWGLPVAAVLPPAPPAAPAIEPPVQS